MKTKIEIDHEIKNQSL